MTDTPSTVPPPPPAWEYSVSPIPAPSDQRNPSAELMRELNGVGSAGWELVAVIDRMIVFKRPAAAASREPEVRPW